jgi:hypothetical protein
VYFPWVNRPGRGVNQPPPSNAYLGPEGSRRVRLPTFSDSRHIKIGKVVSTTHRPLLPPREKSLVFISARGRVEHCAALQCIASTHQKAQMRHTSSAQGCCLGSRQCSPVGVRQLCEHVQVSGSRLQTPNDEATTAPVTPKGCGIVVGAMWVLVNSYCLIYR